MISLADAYEALTANRSYRPALNPQDAQEVIRASLGSQFDPLLGTLFLNLLEDGDPEPTRPTPEL